MVPSLVWLAVVSCGVLVPAALSETSLLRQEGVDHHLLSDGSRGSQRVLEGEKDADVHADENIVVRDGILFQTEGCPQVLGADEALEKIADSSIPGNVVTLISDGPGRAGNHFLTISAYFAMAYCCKTKVLTLPKYDDTFPSAEGGAFASEKRFFDFSGVDTTPLGEYDRLSDDPLVCEPVFQQGGIDAFHLAGIHSDLLSCMNHVYLRGCEAAYLEPLLGTERFGFCAKPTSTHGRHLLDREGSDTKPLAGGVSSVVTNGGSEALQMTARETAEAAAAPLPGLRRSDPSSARVIHDRPKAVETETKDSDMESDTSDHSGNDARSRNTRAAGGAVLDGHRSLRAIEEGGAESVVDGGRHLSTERPPVGENVDLRMRGSAGSLVIHIRSGDIFLHELYERTTADFLGYGQPPLQFYLHAIASQPWSDVTILTFSSADENLNPTFVALEMMQQTGLLGPNVTTHRDRDLLTDVRSMLCADGLAISRSTLHFLTFGHTRAKHFFVPSECGPGTYTRKTRVRMDGTKKPNPNNTTLLCTEKPDAEVYGVEWEVDEDDYVLYNDWEATDAQRLDMVLFDGIKGFSRCCAQ